MSAMKRVLSLAAALFAVAGCGSSDKPDIASQEGKTAFLLDYTLLEPGGTSRRVGDVVKDGPVVLYFVKQGCMSGEKALPLINKLYGAYGEKARFVGVANVKQADFEAWKKETGVTFPVLLDPDKKLIQGL